MGVKPEGTVASGWEPVRDAFATNFEPSTSRPLSAATAGRPVEDPGDLGAALCIVHGGRVVVDVWAGARNDAGHPWREETLVNIYSVGKPVAALLTLQAVDRGEMNLDGPAAEAWPDLAELHPDTTIRQFLSHQGALPAVLDPLPDETIYGWDTMCSALAANPPWWAPGDGHGYHVNTFGFVAAEPARRIHGGAFPELLADRITGPRGLDLFVGLPAAGLTRCADVQLGGVDAGRMTEVLDQMWPGGEPTVEDPATMVRQAYLNPRTGSGFSVVNSTRWRQASVPSTNGHATARAVATLYAALLPDTADPLLSTALREEATTTQVDAIDRVLGRRTRFGLGFMLHQDERPIGTSKAAFGHFGYGGSLGFADPDADLAFAYLINRPGDRWQNPRTVRLLDACRSVVGFE